MTAHTTQFYGRRKGRALRTHKKNLISDFLPQLCVDLNTDVLSHPREFFNDTSFILTDYALDIGFGSGDHTIACASQLPHTGFIGSEVFINSIATLIENIQHLSIKNIRIYPDMIQNLIPHLQDQCIHYVYILFPDPWPKKKHCKRRLVDVDFLQCLIRIMVKGGLIYFASDDAHYIDHMVQSIEQIPLLKIIHHDTVRPEYWQGVTTRYEQKALVKKTLCNYLTVEYTL